MSSPDKIVDLPLPADKQSLPAVSSVEAERALLGGLMLENDTFGDISDIVTPDDFFDRKHQIIFAGIGAMLARDQKCDNVSLIGYLRDIQKEREAGGGEYISHLLIATPSAANVVTYAKIVHDMATRRELSKAGRVIAQRALQPEGMESEEMLQEAERLIFAISESLYRDDVDSMLLDLGEAVDHIHLLEERYKASKGADPVTGIATGLAELDRLTAGLQNGDLFVIAAGSSLGKTSLALHIAAMCAINNPERSVLYCSMEMPKIHLAMRLLSTLSRIPHSDLRIGKIATSHHSKGWSDLNSAIEVLRGARILVDDSQALTPQRIRSRARRIARSEHRAGRRLSLVVVDYLQLIEVPHGRRRDVTRAIEVGMISRALKELARELDIPVIALSQLNRHHERRADGRLFLSDLRDSGAIEQDADVVCFISLPEGQDKEERDKIHARQLYIAKQRNGPTGTFEVDFSGETYLFQDKDSGNKQDSGLNTGVGNDDFGGAPDLP